VVVFMPGRERIPRAPGTRRPLSREGPADELFRPPQVAVVQCMQCPICEATADFSATEYVMHRDMGPLRAPALECRARGAIVLHQAAAHTCAEQAAVRLAQSVRRSAWSDVARGEGD